ASRPPSVAPLFPYTTLFRSRIADQIHVSRSLCQIPAIELGKILFKTFVGFFYLLSLLFLCALSIFAYFFAARECCLLDTQKSVGCIFLHALRRSDNIIRQLRCGTLHVLATFLHSGAGVFAHITNELS